jgi:kynurenine formamidase
VTTNPTATELADLLEVIEGYRIVDLGHELFPGMPGSPTHAAYTFTLVRRHGDQPRDDGISTANELLVMAGHTGTHIDAVGHASRDGRLHGGVDAAAAQVGGRGLTKHGVENLAPIVARGVLLDIAGVRGVSHLAGGYEITPADLDAAQVAAGVKVSSGDVVLLRTGWAKLWDTRSAYLGEDTGTPGPGPGAAVWLTERDVAATGSDTLVYEVVKPGRNIRPVHGHLLVDGGVPIMEGLYLEELAAGGHAEFLFVASPLKLVGATGSPIRPIALVPTENGRMPS